MKLNILVLITTFTILFEKVDAQTWQWASQAGGSENDYCNGIDVDNFGNSYITGTFSDSATFGSTTLINTGVISVYIAKYDINGNFLWAKIAASDSAISVSGICIDQRGTISLVGHYFGTANIGASSTITINSSGSYDAFLARYNNLGDVIWAESIGGSGIDNVGGISSDHNGNVYITGDFHITAFPYSASKIFVAKYDSLGNNIWLKTEINNGNSHFGNSIKTDSIGNSYITGDFFNTIKFTPTDSIDAGNVESNVFLAKFDSAGNYIWGQKAGAATGYCVCKAIDIDGFGNSFITGYYHGTISFGALNITGTSGLGYDVWIAKCNASGNFDWVNKSIGAGNSSAISLDEIGNVFVSGNFDQAITFGSNSFVTLGNYDIFIAELNQSGNFIWATSIGGLQSDITSGATKITSNGIYLAGSFTDTINFGNSIFLANNSTVTSDIFISKLNTITGLDHEIENENFTLYPNPTSGQFTIVPTNENSEIIVTDILGNQIFKTETTQFSTSVKIESYGIYLVYIRTKEGTATKKLIVYH